MIGPLDGLDAIAHRLFGRHADSRRHRTDRDRYAALALDRPFETFVVRVYALSWAVALPVATGVARATGEWLRTGALPAGPAVVPADPSDATILLWSAVAGLLAGGVCKYLLQRAASAGLGYLVRRRRRRIDQTLPGAVRSLHVAATGTVDPRRLLDLVAARPRVHGATADRFRAIRERAALSGGIESAIKRGARDTPARDTLAPFLLSFVERSRAGERELREFLAAESRRLALEDERRHRRAGRYLRLSVGLFVLLCLGPLVVGLGIAGAAVAVPGPNAPTVIPDLPALTATSTAVGSAVVLLLGGGAALFAFLLRPSGHRWAAPAPAQSLGRMIVTSPSNPTNAALLLLPVGLGVLAWGLVAPVPLRTGVVAAYVVVALPVGLVDARRARRRAHLDGALPEFVHDLAERLDDGRPLRAAVADLARTEAYGPLDDPVRKLAADLRMMTGPEGGRKRALERFVGRIGTPFAGRTVGLAVGAIEAGADARSAVTHLRTETGRLVHADRARRARFPVMILVGWTVAAFAVVVVVLVNRMVLATAAPSGPVAGVTVEAVAGAARERPLFYALTQATMLGSGWFAGISGRGVYEALFHSGALVAVTWLGFRLAGLL
jgi:Flp pilus assembly protein TadB